MALQADTDHTTGHGQTHAKVILFGEHSVVYDKPAIAFPVHSLKLEAHAQLHGDSWWLTTPFHASEVGTDEKDNRDLGKLLSETALRNTLTFLGENPQAIEITVSGFIPPARGLGSSAAVAGAISLAVSRLYGTKLTRKELFELVQSVEKVAHGTPSGLDAYATTAEGPIWFSGGDSKPLRVTTLPRLLVADTGVSGHTSEAVSRVRALFTREPTRIQALLDEAEAIATKAGVDLESGTLQDLGSQMNRSHEILNDLGVGAESLDHLVKASRNAGATGAKLTGGGMGGCMLALVTDDETERNVAGALKAAGASAVWRVTEDAAI